MLETLAIPDLTVAFDRIYYQYQPSCLSTCPLTIHAMLHIADSIEIIGPSWTYWAFPMECYCGRLQRKIKSRRYPWASLDSYVVASAQLEHIRISRNLESLLRLQPPRVELPAGSLTIDRCMYSDHITSSTTNYIN